MIRLGKAALAVALLAASGLTNAQVVVIDYTSIGVPISPWLSAAISLTLAVVAFHYFRKRSAAGITLAVLATLVAGIGAYSVDADATLYPSLTGNSPFNSGDLGYPTACESQYASPYSLPIRNSLPYEVNITGISVSPTGTWQLTTGVEAAAQPATPAPGTSSRATCEVGTRLSPGALCDVHFTLVCETT
jgi:hypothetical protein